MKARLLVAVLSDLVVFFLVVPFQWFVLGQVLADSEGLFGLVLILAVDLAMLAFVIFAMRMQATILRDVLAGMKKRYLRWLHW